VFFFCSNRDPQRNGLVNVAKAIIAQLLSGSEALLHYLHNKSSRSGETILSNMALAQDLLDLSLKTRDRQQKTYIIIDGLDEYSRDDRKEIVAWFRKIIETLSIDDLGTLRCLFISQDDGYARKDLSNISQIKISSADNKQDIKTFCESWYAKIEAKFGPIESRGESICDTVSDRSQGE
jgi:hypothetical protein